METKVISRREMLEFWQLVTGYQPLRSDCIIAREDGFDFTSLLEEELKAAYLECLMELPANSAPATDIAAQLTPVPNLSGGAGVSLPASCVRVLGVMMEGWSREAELVTDSLSCRAVAQLNPYSRAGVERPVVILCNGVMEIYPMVEGASFRSVSAVMLPDMSQEYYVTPALMARLVEKGRNLRVL